jgi:hypothetical protein
MKIYEVIPLHKRPLTPQQSMIKSFVKNVENARKRLQAERDRQRREREMLRQRRIGENIMRLKNNDGKLIGVLWYFAEKEEIRDATGKLKGVYFYKSNQTRNRNGELIGIGNLLAALI